MRQCARHSETGWRLTRTARATAVRRPGRDRDRRADDDTTVRHTLEQVVRFRSIGQRAARPCSGAGVAAVLCRSGAPGAWMVATFPPRRAHHLGGHPVTCRGRKLAGGWLAGMPGPPARTGRRGPRVGGSSRAGRARPPAWKGCAPRLTRPRMSLWRANVVEKPRWAVARSPPSAAARPGKLIAHLGPAGRRDAAPAAGTVDDPTRHHQSNGIDRASAMLPACSARTTSSAGRGGDRAARSPPPPPPPLLAPAPGPGGTRARCPAPAAGAPRTGPTEDHTVPHERESLQQART